MPKYLKNSFIAAQKADQDCKRKAGSDIVSKFVKKAMDESIIRRIIGIRLLLTNKDTQKMLTEIAFLYNIRILQPKNIDQICHDSSC